MTLFPNLLQLFDHALADAAEARAAILDQYTPPFDLLSDLLFVLALCPTRPLQRYFPTQPFLSIAGRTPLLLWYSRVREIRYWYEGERMQMGDARSILYHELNTVAFLKRRALFVPAIYATSHLTIQIGHAYGMPKQKTELSFRVEQRRLTSALQDGERESVVTTRLLGSPRPLGWLLSRVLPRWVGPIYFPDGRSTRALIQTAPCVQPAWVRGVLDLETPWLPTPVSLLPLGFYLADQRMTLPPP